MTRLVFPYPDIPPVEIPDSCPVAWVEPRAFPETRSEEEIISAAMANPIGTPRLATMAVGAKNVLILVDDHSRGTPAHLILPEMLQQLAEAGVAKEKIRLMIASGTHRPMTEAEKAKKVGPRVMAEYEVLAHRYDDLPQLTRLPDTPGGTEVWINKAVLESDFLIGLGHIVPHRVAGFTGGGKIVQPGVCGAITTGQTHWLSARFPGVEMIGMVENPVRREIESVALAAGLKFIVNVVLDAGGRTVACVAGDPISAFRAGAQKSLDVFGVPLGQTADIVIVDSYPTDMDLWIAAKGIYSGDLALKPGGVMIFVTPCPEGISPEYPEIAEYGYRPYAEVQRLVRENKIDDLALAAHLVHVGRVICEKGTCVLVSPGIPRETAEKIRFISAATPQEALDYALERKGRHASIAILRNGGEIMPIVGSDAHG